MGVEEIQVCVYLRHDSLNDQDKGFEKEAAQMQKVQSSWGGCGVHAGVTGQEKRRPTFMPKGQPQPLY